MGHPAAFPIFVGSGRSGTTLVQAIFSSHPDLVVVHESQFVPRLARRHHRRNRPFSLGRFTEDLLRNPDVARMGFPPRGLEEAFVRDPPTSYADAVRAVFGLYAGLRDKPRYGDKTPGYVLHMDFLAALFPEARFVHVIRDGRDVALSYMETRFGPRTAAEGAIYWRDRVRSGRSAGARLGPDRYRELRYEDLLRRPAHEVRELCPFLDLEFHPGMLRYFEDGDRLREETADPSAHVSLHLPPTTGLRDWRREMPLEDVAVFEALCGGLLNDLGYERRFPSPRATALVKAAVAWGAWEGKRAAAAFRRLTRRHRSSPTPSG